ncbi:protein L [Pseudomonas atacamensis]|uniref:protein L n=1 Tax=Pseudomonas atacamensis TaxID=2565368 RepID=UPI0021601534|nr:protein L [Pseudomonas atacamensis]UVL16137.1 protein L [Pseudomonas atacamensis]
MPYFTKDTSQYFHEETPKISVLGGDPWGTAHKIGAEVPHSGIYRCTGCGDEITSNKGDKFPPQNSHQHNVLAGVAWKLVARTKTK